jgi:hypothetical protein
VCEPHAVGTDAIWAGASGFVTSKIRRPSKPGTKKFPGKPVIGWIPGATGWSRAVAQSDVV